jgi:hypothetical protein
VRKYPRKRAASHNVRQCLVNPALQQATEGNRNLTGFQLACQLRDDGLAEAEAAEIMLADAKQVP